MYSLLDGISGVADQGENLDFGFWSEPVMATYCVLEGIIEVKVPVPGETLDHWIG
jgi:hypothetical protein